MEKNKLKTMTIIILFIILIGIGGAWAYSRIQEDIMEEKNFINETSYEQGVQDAVILLNSQILQNLQQQGYITFIFELNNETYKTNLYSSNVTLVPTQQNG